MSIKKESDKTSLAGKSQLMLTEKQNNILKIINAFIIDKGYSPSVREICNSSDLSSISTVQSHLKSLQRKGYIKQDPMKSRSVRIVNKIDNEMIKINVKDFNIGNEKNIIPGKYILINKKEPSLQYDLEVLD